MNQQLVVREKIIEEDTSETSINALTAIRKTVFLGVILFGLSTINYFGLNLNQSAFGATLHQFVISMGQAAAISFLTIKSRMSGWSLVLSLFLMYWIVVPFITALETIIFVPDLGTMAMLGLVVNGAIVGFTISLLTVYVYGKWEGEGTLSLRESLGRLSYVEWIWKMIAIGGLYVLVYIASGALIFLPIAGDAINLVYADLEMPDWILQFQFIRGILWALASVPVLLSLKGRKWTIRLGIGIVNILLVAMLVIMPGGISVPQVQIAHFVELAIGHCLVFGLLMTILFCKQNSTFEGTSI